MKWGVEGGTPMVGAGSVSRLPPWRRGTVPELRGRRDAPCSPTLPHWVLGLEDGERVLGPGVWGGGAAPARCCKPAASSAVPNARVLLLPSAAAALLLHPIIVRGGCEHKTKPNQKSNTPKQTTEALPPPPPCSHTHTHTHTPPFADRWHSQDRLRFPGPGEERQSRREAGGGGGRGQADTYRENRFCLRHGERRRGSVLRLPEPPAQRPLRSRSTAAAPRRGAGSSPPPLFLLLLSFFFPPPLALSFSTSLSVRVISAFSAYRGFSPLFHPLLLLHARCPPPEVSLGPAGIREAPGDFPTQAGVYEREGDQAQRRERCFQG